MIVNLASIKYDSLVNGEGLRTVIFSQGCTHNCKGCFNQHTHKFGIGRDYEICDLIDIINRNNLSKKVTFSGGDPFDQSKGFYELAVKLKKLGYNIWSYTGYKIEEILDSEEKTKLLKNIDVLVDGKFVQSKTGDFRYKGSSNQRIIDVQKYLSGDKEKSILKY